MPRQHGISFLNFLKTLLKRVEDHVSGQSSDQVSLDHFEKAKHATRYSVFLATFAEKYSQDAFLPLKGMFDLFRSHALTAGLAAGFRNDQVDKAIKDLCEADRVFLENASEEQIKLFVENAQTVVNSFLAEVDVSSLSKPVLGGMFRI